MTVLAYGCLTIELATVRAVMLDLLKAAGNLTSHVESGRRRGQFSCVSGRIALQLAAPPGFVCHASVLPTPQPRASLDRFVELKARGIAISMDGTSS